MQELITVIVTLTVALAIAGALLWALVALTRTLWRALRGVTPHNIGAAAGTAHRGGSGIVRDIIDGFREGMRR